MRRLRHDRRAISAVEFGFAAPVIMAVMLGGLEMGHTMYVKAVLDGEVQKAARDLALESASLPARRQAIHDRVEARIQQLVNQAHVSLVTTAYHDYSDARDREEPYNDINHDGRCDWYEPYIDSNNNGHWDADSGKDGPGGAKDVLLLTMTATYPRLALSKVWSDSDTVTLTAKTMLRNQPSSDQTATPQRNCPL